MIKDRQYDIGIYTFWNVPNYGTFAQAYALQKAIQKMYPNRDVRQISYLDDIHYKFYYSRIPRCKIWKKRFIKELLRRNTIAAKEKCNLFLENYNSIPHTENFTKDSLMRAKFNTIVIGSDIVWDYSFDCFNHDRFLFGLDFDAKKIVSYAASFGTIKKGGDYPAYVVEGIRKFANITVREENSAVIVEEITGIKPKIVLDPTWIWDFNTDPLVEISEYKNYIVVYGQDFTNKFINEIIEYSKKKKLKIVCLDCNDDNYSWCDVLLKQDKLSPYQWFGIFKGAEAVATSTFHGLTFSLIFNKKLAFCKSDFILAKAGTFLKELGLYDLYTNDDNTVMDMLERDWNYTEINKYIEKMRKGSLEVLRNLIEE